MMSRPRVIPVLLIRNLGLVKTKKFKNPIYIGDPINTVRIFSEKEADEIIVLDIEASLQGRGPNFDLVSQLAGECLMPMAYGGGIQNLEQVRRLIRSGVEKVIINSTAATQSLAVITEAARYFGSQAVVGAIDVKKNLFGKYRIMAKSGSIGTEHNLKNYVKELVNAGAGELFVNSIDADGTMQGFDIDLISLVAESVDVPVIACGGAGSVKDLSLAIHRGGASAVAAGSMFVFHGKKNAVLISYNPSEFVRGI